MSDGRVECISLKQSNDEETRENGCVQQITCNDNSQCAQGEICVDGVCIINLPECTEDLQCRNNQYCDKMSVPFKCKTIICVIDRDCKKKGLKCRTGQCETVTNLCKNDCDCKEYELCLYVDSEKKCTSVSCDSSIQGYLKCINWNSKCMNGFCISNCQNCCRRGLKCDSRGLCEGETETTTESVESTTNEDDEICRNPSKFCNGIEKCIRKCEKCCKSGKTCKVGGLCKTRVSRITPTLPFFTTPDIVITESSTAPPIVHVTCVSPDKICKGNPRCIKRCKKCCRKGNQECGVQGTCKTIVGIILPTLEGCHYCDPKTETCKDDKCVPIDHCQSKNKECKENGNCVYEWDKKLKDYDGKCMYPIEKCGGKCRPKDICSLSANCTKEEPPCSLKCQEGYECNPKFRTCTLIVESIGCNNIRCSDGEVCTDEAM